MARKKSVARQYRPEAENYLATSTRPIDLAWAHMILGLCHEEEHAWGAATESYRKGIECKSSDVDTQYFCNNNLGFSLIQLGHFQEAERYCETAIEIDNMRHNAHKNLGLVRQALGQLLDAATSFAVASILAPGDPRAWALLETLLASHPELLAQSDDLRLAVEQLRGSANAGSRARFQ